MTQRPLGIPAMGIAAPVGIGKLAVARGVFAGSRAGLVARDGLIPGRQVYVGAVEGILPVVPPHHATRNSRLMLAALDEIREDVGRVARQYGRERIAVILGTSTSGVAEGEEAFAIHRAGQTWPAGFDYRQQELGALAAFAADALDLEGPAYTIATACSSSAKVFATARRLIATGLCDAAVVGGADSICGTTLNGFGALEALSRGYCNPFSRNRDGINIGEAAAAFLVTREEAPVNLLGIGETSDAHHMSAPDPTGRGALGSMQAALDDANLTPDDIGYVNLHGTGTPLNDSMEGIAIATLFGASVPCSSTKGMTGHTLGAAGACEAAFLWLSLHPDFSTGTLPPHVWDGVPDPAIPSIGLVGSGSGVPRTGRLAMMSNSFAFGGSNVSLLLGRSS
jgi:3-oxoacyl-[acyl-carrier-protein] synthase I